MSTRPTSSRALNLHAQPAAVKGKVFTTVDNGKLHVAVGNRYVGAIDSYNNCVSRFVANLFGWSEQVAINGKVRHVEREEYIRFLNENTVYNDVCADNIKNYVDFNALKIEPMEDKGTMRQNISQYKANYLFQKLASAIVDKADYEKAKKLVGKGADLDRFFWVREGQGISFTTLTAGLSKKNALEFQAGRYTPLLYAAVVNNKSFAEYLDSFGADCSAQGETLKFKRKIVGVSPGGTVVRTTESDSHIQQRVETSTILDMQDITVPQYYIQCNPDDYSVLWTENREPKIINNYDCSQVRYSTNLIRK
ncbi:MAG: hypothetical protein JSR46_11415 [Verrucomicrobia bacterium]|nr:hypothetical protein [Verrucomicrobiota bacterium]